MEAATASASISSSSVVRVVPTVPGMRTRKRGDDDSCSTENDSMRPLADPRRTKRARRTILDAFSSISLKKQRNGGSTPGDGGAEDQLLLDEDADSSRAVAEDDGGYTTNSSLEEEDGVTDDCDDDEPMLSDKEAIKKDVERKV